VNNEILFSFDYHEFNFLYVQRHKIHTMICTMEIHATSPKGEEFLADEDNYNDAFQAGRSIFIQINTERLRNNVQMLQK